MFALSGKERVPVSGEMHASSAIWAVERLLQDRKAVVAEMLRQDRKSVDRADSEKVFAISGKARAFVALAIRAAIVIPDPVRVVEAACKA